MFVEQEDAVVLDGVQKGGVVDRSVGAVQAQVLRSGSVHGTSGEGYTLNLNSGEGGFYWRGIPPGLAHPDLIVSDTDTANADGPASGG
jgi:hypothetical protein